MSTATEGHLLGGEGDLTSEPTPGSAWREAYGPTLVLTLTLAAGLFLLVMAALLLVVHPGPTSLETDIIRQRQSAKTFLYVASFAIILPLAVFAVPRLVARIAQGSNAPALAGLTYGLAGLLAAALVAVRVLPISHHGVRPLLVVVALWWVLAAAVLIRATQPRPWPALLALARATPALAVFALAGLFAVILCVTSLGSLSAAGLGIGAVVALVAIWGWGRVSPAAPGRLVGGGVDVVVCVLLLLAVVNVVIYHASAALPSTYFPPGVIQFQQDWMLAPANQLLAGGALLVNVPSSQYGVGLVYLLWAWFHIAPISYATFGLLDGLLTALVYICGYVAVRIAGVSRTLAAATMALAVAVFVYHLQYPIGQLPEQGPLRFGLPMAVIVAVLVGLRWPRWSTASTIAGLLVVGVSSIWALENFAYTLFTYLAMVGVVAILRPAGQRMRWAAIQLALAVSAAVAAHLILAGATLAATGQLPDWSQYLAHVNTLLLGGPQGAVTYGFADWSPGVALGAAWLASAAALLLVVLRRPNLAQVNRTLLVAVAGLTAYAIASFSYTDNRSSTYLLPYVALPTLLAAVLWTALFLRERAVPRRERRLGLAFALAVTVVMLAAAWPTIGTEFSQSALAHAYPGGGLRTALHRLWHPPPIDPRAPAVARVLTRYLPGRHVLVLLPAATDLALEAEMRAGKANLLFLGDPAEDIWVPSVWTSKIGHEIAVMKPGLRVLMDRTALDMARRLQGRSASSILDHPLPGGNAQIEWILHGLSQRFRFEPIHRGPDGLVVVRLRAR